MIEIKKEDIEIYEWDDSKDPNKTELNIMVKDSNKAEQLKSQILQNQKLVNDVLVLWLQLLDHGIGGLPTNEEAEIFSRLSDIIPKELRDNKLKEILQKGDKK